MRARLVEPVRGERLRAGLLGGVRLLLRGRAVTGRMLAQLAWVASRDADAEPDRGEERRLRALAARLFYRAHAAGQTADGLDYVFGDDVPTY
jgi:hypothetical protein